MSVSPLRARRRAAVLAAAALALCSAAAGAWAGGSSGTPARPAGWAEGGKDPRLLVYEKISGSRLPSVWIARADGHGARQLAAGATGPSISPDGRTVVYATAFTGPGSHPKLMAVPAPGGRAQALLDPWWGSEGTFAWSPDSTTIATVTGPELGRKRLLLIDVASGRVLRVVGSGWFFGASFSPAGDRLVYARAASGDDPLRVGADLFTVSVSGGAPTRLTHAGVSVGPLWGPASIVFARQHRPARSNDIPKQNLYLIAPTGGSVRQLTHERIGYLEGGLSPVAWSADGRRLLAEFGGQDTSYAETVDPRTGHVRAVPGQLVGFALSRDGSTILAATGGFEPGLGAPNNVVAVSYAGGKPRVLVRGAFYSDWNR
jgi:hypothetical protein